MEQAGGVSEFWHSLCSCIVVIAMVLCTVQLFEKSRLDIRKTIRASPCTQPSKFSHPFAGVGTRDHEVCKAGGESPASAQLPDFSGQAARYAGRQGESC